MYSGVFPHEYDMTYPCTSYCIEKGAVQHLMNQLFVEELWQLSVLKSCSLSPSLSLCSTIFFTGNINVRGIRRVRKEGAFQEHFGYSWNSKSFVSKPNVKCYSGKKKKKKERWWASFRGFSRAKIYMHCSFPSECIVYVLNNTLLLLEVWDI